MFIVQNSGTTVFTRIKNQSHTRSGSKDMIFQSRKCHNLIEFDKTGAKYYPQSSKKSLVFGTLRSDRSNSNLCSRNVITWFLVQTFVGIMNFTNLLNLKEGGKAGGI